MKLFKKLEKLRECDFVPDALNKVMSLLQENGSALTELQREAIFFGIILAYKRETDTFDHEIVIHPEDDPAWKAAGIRLRKLLNQD
jgi:hypothetical protein